MIEAVFKRTRVTVGVMTAAKLSQRGRAGDPVPARAVPRRRAGPARPPRYELGIQQREDALHRLVEVWATGEAGASLGFGAARLFDELDPLEKQKTRSSRTQGISGRGRAEVKKINAKARSSC